MKYYLTSTLPSTAICDDTHICTCVRTHINVHGYNYCDIHSVIVISELLGDEIITPQNPHIFPKMMKQQSKP